MTKYKKQFYEVEKAEINKDINNIKLKGIDEVLTSTYIIKVIPYENLIKTKKQPLIDGGENSEYINQKGGYINFNELFKPYNYELILDENSNIFKIEQLIMKVSNQMVKLFLKY